MYLHLGSDKEILLKNVIGFFDMDNTTVSAKTRKFLRDAQKNGEICDIAEDLPKSFVVAQEFNKTKVYVSSVATRTLIKRVKSENMNI